MSAHFVFTTVTIPQTKAIFIETPSNPMMQVTDVKAVSLIARRHNLWTAAELTRLDDICVKYVVYVVSDEIHADFVFKGYKYTVFSNLKPKFADIAVTCTAPSKSFNLPGLQTSNIFIENQNLKTIFEKGIEKGGYAQINQMGLIACQTAYQYGG